ncbi:hypothetical protein NL676_029976 [Syzygium grande]|nr:hypothetical protein NL676_029976 [Syzygium grande]
MIIIEGSKRKKLRREKDGASPVPAEMEGEEVDVGNSPSPKTLANLDVDGLQSKCKIRLPDQLRSQACHGDRGGES